MASIDNFISVFGNSAAILATHELVPHNWRIEFIDYKKKGNNGEIRFDIINTNNPKLILDRYYTYSISKEILVAHLILSARTFRERNRRFRTISTEVAEREVDKLCL